MKFLKYFLLFILLIVVGTLIFAAMQPSEYNVARSKVIKAPIASVFNTVNDLKTWEKWGPWHDEDSTIVVTYGEKTIGVAAKSSWTSKDGPGTMTTVNVVSKKLIEQKIQMGDADPSDIIWDFKEVKDGVEVTWRMKEDNAPFVFKAISGFMGGWEKFFGPMQEKGLANLERVILEDEKLKNSFTVSEVQPVVLEDQKFIGHYVKMEINHEEMTKAFTTLMPKAGIYAMKNGLKYGDFTPAAVYTKYDEKTNETEFYIGLLLHKDLKSGDDMTALNLPAGNAVKVSKFGNYGNGDEEAHIKIDKYLKSNNKIQNWPIWELYVNDPTTVKPQYIQTDIYYPIK